MPAVNATISASTDRGAVVVDLQVGDFPARPIRFTSGRDKRGRAQAFASDVRCYFGSLDFAGDAIVKIARAFRDHAPDDGDHISIAEEIIESMRGRS